MCVLLSHAALFPFLYCRLCILNYHYLLNLMQVIQYPLQHFLCFFFAVKQVGLYKVEQPVHVWACVLAIMKNVIYLK